MYAVNVTMTKLADFLYITIYLQEMLIIIQYISVLSSGQETESTAGISGWKCCRSRSQGAANRLLVSRSMELLVTSRE